MTTTVMTPPKGLLADPTLIRLARAMHASGWRRLGPRRRTHRAVRAWQRGPREVVTAHIRPANGDVDIEVSTPAGAVRITRATSGAYALTVVAAALGLTAVLTSGNAFQVTAYPSTARRLYLVPAHPGPERVNADAAALDPLPPRIPLRVVGPPRSTPFPSQYGTKGPRP